MDRLKSIVITLMLMIVVIPVIAREQADTVYTFRFCHVRDMFYVPAWGNDKELVAMLECVDTLRDDIYTGRVILYVDGYCNSAKTDRECLAIAKIRSNRVKSELIVRKGIREEHFITHNHADSCDMVTVRVAGNANSQTRRSAGSADAKASADSDRLDTDICSKKCTGHAADSIYTDSGVYMSADTASVSAHCVSAGLNSLVGPVDSAVTAGEHGCAGCGWRLPFPLAIRTNALYDVLLVPNIGVSAMITDRLVAGVDWMGTWLNDSKHHYYRIYGGHVDLSWRLGDISRLRGPFSGHHVGVYASMIYYDLQRGLNHRGYLSDKYNYAVGLQYTYTHPLSRCFDISFTVGMGYMWGTYKRHTPIDDHDVWLSTHRRSWFGPTRAAISLVWVPGGNGAPKPEKGGREQ